MNYENRVVAFIDILGFGNIVDNTINDAEEDKPTDIEAVNDALLLVRENLDIDDTNKFLSNSKRVTQFSDSIVISFLADEESEVFYTLFDILHLSLQFIYKGYVCRGGVTYGKLIHTDKILFGPAMVRAYELESMAAIYPRIIIDESVIEIGAKNNASQHSAAAEKQYIKSILAKDSDDMYYIDYFSNGPGELDDPELDMPIFMNKLRKIIEKGLNTSKVDIRLKYEWMKNKFNILVGYATDPKFISKQKDPDLICFYEKLEKI